MKSLKLLSVILAGSLSAILMASESLGWIEEFDNVAQPRWQTIPKCAEIMPKDTLSAANRVVRIAPPMGIQNWLLSSDKFVSGDLEITFAAQPDPKGEVFYYIGFHETEPWLKALAWIQIHNTTVTFGIKNPEGGTLSREIGHINGKYQTLKINQSSGILKVTFDGKESSFKGKNLITKEAMPVFVGAFSNTGQADLKIDSIKVSGGKVKPRFIKLEQSEKEKAIVKKMNNSLELSSGNTQIALGLNGGLHWKSVVNTGANLLAEDVFSPVFAMRIGNRIVYSHEFTIINANADDREFTVELLDRESMISAILRAKSASENRVLMQLELKNSGNNAQTVQAIFPIISNINPGKDLDKVKYFFPWRGGILGDCTASFTAEYNGFAWMQLMFAYSPQNGHGIGLFPEDANGRFKGLMMQKGKNGLSPTVKHSEVVIFKEQPSLDLLEKQSAVAFAQYYRGDLLQPGNSTITPQVRIFAFKGDWKSPLKQYSSWMKARMQKVDVPRWFRDTYTWLNGHPPFYYDEAKKEYVLHKRLAGGENAIQIAFWDDYPLPYAERLKYPSLASTMPGEFFVNKGRGGAPALAAEVERCHQLGAAFTLYIDHRFCWKETNLAKKHGKSWATKDAQGNYPGYVTADDQYLMCFYDTDKWVEYMTTRCRSLVKELKLDGIYLDELAVNFQCYNETHDHYKAGKYPTDPHGIVKAMVKVRNAMREANPNAALMTEHAGSDYLTQFFDGSWDQTFYIGAFPFVEKYYDDLRINFFHFCFPNFKFSEWGSSTRHPWRNLFNGFGMDMGGFENTDIQRQFAQIMKENGDAFASENIEPIVKTTHKKFLANRFPHENKIIHTVYNTSEKMIMGSILETKSSNKNIHYVELIEDKVVNVNTEGLPELSVEAERTAVLASFPIILNAKKTGNTIEITFDKTKGDKIVVCEDFDDEHFFAPRGKWTKLAAPHGKAIYKIKDTNAKKYIIKLFKNDYLADEVIL